MPTDAFLHWALPRLGLRWAGFQRNRRQVARRIHRRIVELGLADVAAYQQFLDAHPEEWRVLDGLCRVTISRFARDREMWDALVADVLPRLAREASAAGRPAVEAWSAGCGAGEEPYTLAIAWAMELAPTWPALELRVLATDVDDVQLARAAAGWFPAGTLRELPEAWRAAFEGEGSNVCLRERFRAPVRFAHHDVRTPPPAMPFDLVLCRNLAFSYFDEPVQRAVTAALRAVLRSGGVLVVGRDERLPDGVTGFAVSSPGIYIATA